MKYLYWSFCLLLTTMSNYTSAQVTNLSATIDKNPMLLDESVTLQVTAVGSADSDAIDFLTLTKDFRVGQPSVSKSTQIINFDRTTTTTWTLQLFPRATGPVTIPSFSIDGQSSEPITLNVLPVSAAAQAQPRDFYVTTEVSSNQVYLQQQVQYKVKIYLAADIQRGSLTEPVLDGAVIEQLGDDKEYQELVNGVRYRVIERNFAVLPQSSGNFVIDGPVFQAEVLSNTRQSFAFFDRSKTVNRVAPTKELRVLPIPENYQHTWLPSEQVQLDEQWQGNDNEFVQGEPITRTLTLTALGLIEEQLPPIDAQYHPSFKTYPEQPEKATVKQDNRLIAQSVQSTAIIPSETGTFVLPEIRVPWFDVNSGETKFAILPAKSVSVIPPPAANNAVTAQPTAPAASVEPTERFDDEASTQDATAVKFPIIMFGLDALHVVMGLTIFILIAMLLISRRKPVVAEIQQSFSGLDKTDTENASWLKLNQAIDSQNIKMLQTHLRTWLGHLTQQQIQSVNNALLNLQAGDAAALFNQALASQYGGASEEYQPDSLKQALIQLRQREHDRRDSIARTNMYPIT